MKTWTMTPKKLYRLLVTELNDHLPADKKYPVFTKKETWRYAVPTFYDDRVRPVIRDYNSRLTNKIWVRKYKTLLEVSVVARPQIGALRAVLEPLQITDQSIIYDTLRNHGFKVEKPSYISSMCVSVKIDRKQYRIDPRTENGEINYLIWEILK